MITCESLSHTKWECKYHVVFIPKCRKKLLYGQLRRERTRRQCVDTSKNRRKKTNASNNWRWRRFERLTVTNNPL